MRGAIRVTLIKHDGEYQVPIFGIDQPHPDPEAETARLERIRARDDKIVALREQMGARWIGHPDYVKPSANEGKLL